MAEKTISAVAMHLHFEEAVKWVNQVIEEELDDTLYIDSVEVKRMPGGSYRAGVIFKGDQYELFGAEEDA